MKTLVLIMGGVLVATFSAGPSYGVTAGEKISAIISDVNTNAAKVEGGIYEGLKTLLSSASLSHKNGDSASAALFLDQAAALVSDAKGIGQIESAYGSDLNVRLVDAKSSL